MSVQTLAACSFSHVKHTSICDADTDVAPLELCLAQFKSLLEAIKRSKLDIGEALGPSFELVLDDANVGNIAAVEKMLDISLGHVKGEVAKVCCEGGSGRERECFAERAALAYVSVSQSVPHVSRA